MADRYGAIREALAMGPTPGPWVDGPLYSVVTQDYCAGKKPVIALVELIPAKLDECLANKSLICACDPDTIRAMLEELDAQQAEIERLRKLHQDAYQRGHQSGSRGLREAYDAIQEVKRQDAWGNAQLTEALLAAEERAERVEFENAALTAENERLKEQLSAPPGYVLVPVVPTDTMVCQGGEYLHDTLQRMGVEFDDSPGELLQEIAEGCFNDMLAAAPEPKP